MNSLLIAMSFADMWWVFLLGMFFSGCQVIWNLKNTAWFGSEKTFEGIFVMNFIPVASCGLAGLLFIISLICKIVEMLKG